jgi:predicted Zn-dependent protease with MMP-like domain
MNDEEFAKIVEAAIKNIPEEFQNKLENVSMLVEDLPTPNQLNKLRARGERGMLLGLYEGVPQTRRGHYGIGGHLPDKITIFKFPIERIARSKVHLIQIVVNTVKHEIAHHFGMDEHQVRDAEHEARTKK